MLSFLVRRGLRRGLIEGSRPWLFLGVGAGVVAVLRRLTAEPPATVWREPLDPGQGVLIRVSEPGDAS